MKIVFFFLVAAMLMSCEETIQLDFKTQAPQLVIDAQVLNIRKKSFVKITTTAAFSSTGATPRVADATVTLNDGVRPAVTFAHNPRQHPDSIGYYLPPPDFVGRQNTSYTVAVVLHGKTYTAVDFLAPVTPLGSLTPVVVDVSDQPRINGRTHDVLIAFSPPENEAYFLFRFLRNGSPAQTLPGEVYLLDRQQVGEDIEDLSFGVLYAPSETATVQIQRVSKEVYTYYFDLENSSSADGLFSPPPLNPRTNWSNGATGVFRAAAQSERSVVIN
jgi:hypothetical protein